MSVNYIKEILINYYSFRNIDLLNQGVYKIKTKVYYKYIKNSKLNTSINVLGCPYFNTVSVEQENLQKPNNKNNENNNNHLTKPHNISPPFLDELNAEYTTKTFVIRYSDEEVELDEFCVFRLEIASDKIKEIYVIFDLLYSDNINGSNYFNFSKNKFPSKDNNTGAAHELNTYNQDNNKKFRNVYSSSICINEDMLYFQDSHIPIIFQDAFSSLLSVNINYVNTNLKFSIDNYTTEKSKNSLEDDIYSPFAIEEEYLNYYNNVENNVKNYYDIKDNINDNNKQISPVKIMKKTSYQDNKIEFNNKDLLKQKVLIEGISSIKAKSNSALIKERKNISDIHYLLNCFVSDEQINKIDNFISIKESDLNESNPNSNNLNNDNKIYYMSDYIIDNIYDKTVMKLISSYIYTFARYSYILEKFLISKENNAEYKEDNQSNNSKNSNISKKINCSYTSYTEDNSDSENLEDNKLDNNNNYLKKQYKFFLKVPKFKIYSEPDDLENFDFVETSINFFVTKRNTIKCLSKRIYSKEIDYVLSRILIETNFISLQISQLWHKLIELIRLFPNEYNFLMQYNYYDAYSQELCKFIRKSSVSIVDNTTIIYQLENNQLKLNENLSSEVRNTLIKTTSKPYIEITNLYINPDIFPILFEENYVKKYSYNELNTNNMTKSTIFNSSYASPLNKIKDNKESLKILNTIENNKEKCIEEYNLSLDCLNISLHEANKLNSNLEIAMKPDTLALHLIVLVHGFQGNSFDMRLIKYNLSLINQNLVFLSSQSNQDDTESDFKILGERLANEVKQFMKEWNNGIMFNKISFIGHSIGGIIIRSCLPLLEEYSCKMFFYCSLSSPHLGYAFTNSTLVDAGMWLLKKIKKCVSLEQLSFSDEKSMDKSFLYELSEAKGLKWFKHIFLISSHQDFYAPFESTRIQANDKLLGNDGKSTIYRKMALNLLGNLPESCNLKRIDVNFVISEK